MPLVNGTQYHDGVQKMIEQAGRGIRDYGGRFIHTALGCSIVQSLAVLVYTH